MPRKIIIDTDPGQDDAVAILLALASPELEVMALTAVAGNVPLALTQKNARQIVELSGHQTPVYAGCDAPMKRKLVTAEYVHGKTGLDGIPLPEPSLPLQHQHAVDYLIDTLRALHEEGMSINLAAHRLGVHANTIGARVRRILDLTHEQDAGGLRLRAAVALTPAAHTRRGARTSAHG